MTWAGRDVAARANAPSMSMLNFLEIFIVTGVLGWVIESCESDELQTLAQAVRLAIRTMRSGHGKEEQRLKNHPHYLS